jgi:hypothetical protein
MVNARLRLGIGLVGLLVTTGACDVVIGIPDRRLADHLECADGKCVCTAGFGDCDGDPGNGCEAPLIREANCGACGHDCQNGSCEAGTCQCSAGFEDCDGSPKNGCEARLADDAHHCGACGHDCLGGACDAGLCQPFTLHGFSYPQAIAVSGGLLVLALCSSPVASPLVELPVAGGDPVAIATSADCGVFETISGGTVYWSNDAGIFASALAAPGMPTTFQTTTTARAVAATSTLLYWESFDSMTMKGSLSRAPLAGGAVETLTSQKATSLRLDAEQAYWGEATGLYAVPHTGTTPVKLAGVEVPGAIDVDATSLYVMEQGMTGGGIVSVPLVGGTPKALAPMAATFALKVDGDTLYWLDYGDGKVYQMSLSKGTTRVLAEGLGGATNAQLAVDATAVYWLSDQSVYKMAK